MNKEIELKFEVVDFPVLNSTHFIEIYKILQYYIYKDSFSAIRKRSILNVKSKEQKYIYTVKTKGDLTTDTSIYEIETEITKEQYDGIKDNLHHLVEKYRINIPIDNGLIAELDIYYGTLDGLLTVEVEFPNESNMADFIKPNWFGNELSKKQFSNAKLSKMSRDEFLTLLDEKQLENNMNIRQFLEKSILNL